MIQDMDALIDDMKLRKISFIQNQMSFKAGDRLFFSDFLLFMMCYKHNCLNVKTANSDADGYGQAHCAAIVVCNWCVTCGACLRSHRFTCAGHYEAAGGGAALPGAQLRSSQLVMMLPRRTGAPTEVLIALRSHLFRC